VPALSVSGRSTTWWPRPRRPPKQHTRRKKQSTVILWKQEKQPYAYQNVCIPEFQTHRPPRWGLYYGRQKERSAITQPRQGIVHGAFGFASLTYAPAPIAFGLSSKNVDLLVIVLSASPRGMNARLAGRNAHLVTRMINRTIRFRGPTNLSVP